MSAHLPRVLSSDDAPALAALHAKCFETGWPVSDMTLHIDGDVGFAVGEAAICGFILVRIAFEQAEILTLAVDTGMRKQGLARALLRAAEKSIVERGVTSLFLEVAEDNLPAIALYKSCGYEAFGRRPAYYKRKDGRIAALNFAKRF